MKLNQRTLSIFDILGPVMIGPSSNHTGGANRIGQIARMILGEEPTEINFYFYGALAETYKGHMTDLALIAGLLEIKIDDIRIREALDIAEKKHIEINVFTQSSSDKNPNTIELLLKTSSHSVRIESVSVGGGEILIEKIDEFKVNFYGNKDMILVVNNNSHPENLSKIKEKLGKNLIETEIFQGDERNLACFYINTIPGKNVLNLINKMENVSWVRLVRSIYSYQLINNVPAFKSIEEMLALAKKQNKSLPELVVFYESSRSGLNENGIRERIKHIWEAMKEEIQQGLEKENHLIGGLMNGKDAKLLYNSIKNNNLIFGKPLALAVARAIACGEVNASMGRVVAAPTAGAVGVIPAVLLTAAEVLNSDEKDITDALLVASIIGLIIANKAPISGAMGGCQSEVGVASAMAASAIVQLAGGSSEQVVQAMSLALKNLFGLVCDTVAGPVEVPCIKRNVIGVANAFAVADMALAGIKSIIPPDEVIDALRNIQILMPVELRDTTLGGLGSTETAKKLKKEWLEKIQKI
jgi:L-serine dehydratase